MKRIKPIGLTFQGRNHTAKTKEKMRMKALGRKFTKIHKVRLSESHRGSKSYTFGKKLSETTRRKISEAQKGEKGYWWKGGITPLLWQIRNCFEYRQWRSDVFTKDNFTCRLCGIRGTYLEADHYPKMFSVIFHENKIRSLEEALNCEELWNINNGRTLCRSCHDKTKKYKHYG